MLSTASVRLFPGPSKLEPQQLFLPAGWWFSTVGCAACVPSENGISIGFVRVKRNDGSAGERRGGGLVLLRQAFGGEQSLETKKLRVLAGTVTKVDGARKTCTIYKQQILQLVRLQLHCKVFPV